MVSFPFARMPGIIARLPFRRAAKAWKKPQKVGIDKRPEFLYNLLRLKTHIWKTLGKNKKYLLVQIKGKEDSP